MRGRWVKPEFFRDKKMGKLGPVPALVYQALWIVADDGGTAPCDPEQLKGDMFTYWSAVGVPEITGALRHLSGIGRIKCYTVGDETYCTIVNFVKHQNIHKPSKFRYPPEGQPFTFNGAESSGTSEALVRHSPPPRHLDTYSPREDKKSGASAPTERTFGDWMGLIREIWNATPEEMKTNGSILKALLAKGNLSSEFEAAIRGLPMVIKNGDRPSMRLLYAKSCATDMFNRAAAFWNHYQSKQAKPGMDTLKSVMEGIAK